MNDFEDMTDNALIKIMVGCLLEQGDLDADNEHVASAYRMYRSDDSLYTVDGDTLEFSFDSQEYVVMQEDAYEQHYEEMLDMYLDDIEYDGRKSIENLCMGPYWKFDRETFARDIEYGGERGSVLCTYDGEIHELYLADEETLYYWRTN